MTGSKPFDMSPGDWKEVGVGAVLAMLGGLAAYLTASVIPLLQEKTANELGSLLIALAATALPILSNIVRKYLGDTTQPIKLIVLGAAMVLTCCGTASAEYGGATAAVISGGLFANLLNDPLMLAVILLGASLFASKVLKIDLSAFILPIITSLLKPPGPTPQPVVVPPGPTPTPTPTPTDPSALLQFLLDLLLKAKSSGDAEQEAAALKLLERFRAK